ncbi:MAG: hypothetical protein M1825_003965 [Sarcosagium campestre]|nr:MAG: hypothetical protein M1825_003965 [Sarcosagium campestre]
MPPPKGSATFKKKDGTLALAKDSRSVSWTPIAPPGAPASLTVQVSSITNLQQTPAGNPKVMLRIFEQAPNAAAPEIHQFAFTSPTAARAEADAIKDALSNAIQTAKAGSPTAASVTAAPGGGGGHTSAAMAMASAVSSTAGGLGGSTGWHDDARLKSDTELQQSLLKSDPALQRTLMESLRTKPESITHAQFTQQFWSTRTQLLRAHAIDRNQSRGQYNVLSTLKAKTEDNVTRLSISKEQIQLIFNQHPLVKRVYDENVPKLNESAFWSKFFQSRLLKKLKGEKIIESDPLDPVLDKYLNYDQDGDRDKRNLAARIPHIIDVEGNEENHSQRKGNQPDWTMRPRSHAVVRNLNEISERIMAQVAPVDVDPSEPIGMDEETFNELALKDLQGDAKEQRIILNIRDQKRFFANNKDSTSSAEAKAFSLQNPADVISAVQTDIELSSSLSLDEAIGLDAESGSEGDADDDADSLKKPAHVGSQSTLAGATKQILRAIGQQRSQTGDLAASSVGFSEVQVSTCGLSAALSDRLILTHATTTEFLHHFWLAFLSGDPDRAGELAKLHESLNRALDRIQAVAADAEDERSKEAERKKREIRDVYQATGKKVRFRPETVGGGAEAVNEILAPTIKAIGLATERYRAALRAEGIDVVPAV